LKRRKAFVVDEQVEKILLRSKKPVGAYQIASKLSRVAATQVYRALERLVLSNKARRIVARNAYVAITTNTDLIAICRKCGEFRLLECPGAVKGLELVCDNQAFQIERICLEMTGTCHSCGKLL
jgi:Fur family transcriptional regulator, zinc uptake regulator